ncbi:hypothetical protein [Hyalangium gracile]|uniref:hypothetical protein n=1 Tax=Hyalangium gracile TaxID=394092 RepID=UPI001CCA48CF|nr:hypothetical protein [Hyalangium gracile]
MWPDCSWGASRALTGAFHWWDIGAYGHVGADLNKRIQTVGRSFGYTGPIDGVPGPNTYTAEHKICGYAVNRAF